MKSTIRFTKPQQCFLALEAPMATQKIVLQVKQWMDAVACEMGDRLHEIVIEPRGCHFFFKKKVREKNLKKTLAVCWETLAAKHTIPYRSWVFPLFWDSSSESDLMHHFQGDKGLVTDYQKQFIRQPLYASFYGFLPGFVYMGGLPKNMQLPRRNEPRLQVPHGSVAVGERYVGIYPQASPGGWQLLGRTPVALFDRDRTPSFFLEPGDRILWESIEGVPYEKWETTNEFFPKHTDETFVL